MNSTPETSVKQETHTSHNSNISGLASIGLGPSSPVLPCSSLLPAEVNMELPQMTRHSTPTVTTPLRWRAGDNSQQGWEILSELFSPVTFIFLKLSFLILHSKSISYSLLTSCSLHLPPHTLYSTDIHSSVRIKLLMGIQ